MLNISNRISHDIIYFYAFQYYLLENFERVYKYQGSYYILAGIGSNGFLVSAYPINMKGGK